MGLDSCRFESGEKAWIAFGQISQALAAESAILLALAVANLVAAVIASFVMDLVFSGPQVYAIGIEGILSQFSAIQDAALNVHLHIRVLSRVAKHFCHRPFEGVWE